MKSIYNFIVSTEDRYNNSVDVDGQELVINTEITERDAEYVNRIATVVATPMLIDTPVEVGDQIIIHHNVFRRWYDVRGKERNGSSWLTEDKYRVHIDQIYAYNKGDGWLAAPGYCFVKPIKERPTVWDTQVELPLMGHIDIGHELLNIDRGDLVGFTPESEYLFYIDKDPRYRIKLNDIIWTSKKNVNELLHQLSSH